jgi:hypothetical protein
MWNSPVPSLNRGRKWSIGFLCLMELGLGAALWVEIIKMERGYGAGWWLLAAVSVSAVGKVWFSHFLTGSARSSR